MLRRIKTLIPRPLFSLYHFVRAVLAVLRYGYPARTLTVIGVTGTDGKTTTTHILFSILRQAGLPASLISTTGAIISGRENQPLGLHVTTPNPFDLQHFLREAKRSGSKYIVLESTSHGLAQYRVLGSNFKVGVLTNITHEHLDFHGTYQRYLLDKARLFRGVQVSVLNRDDSSYERLKSLAAGKILTYGLEPGAQITASEWQLTPSGMQVMIPEIDRMVRTRFAGQYNLQNMLAATAAALSLGIAREAIAAGLEKAQPPPGRLEPVDMGQPFSVFVDFAHTPNSLENVLKLLRGMADKNLVAVFGAAGERDRGKRFPMGASAGRYCDFTVISAEDPRSENLKQIMEHIAHGVESEGGVRDKTYFCVADRQEAINFAIRELARPGDIVVACGKAHEQSMCFGAVEYPWDEFKAVRHALGDHREPPIVLPTSRKAVV